MKNQIEEMIRAFDDYCNNEVPDDVCARTRCIDCHVKSLIKAGYRKSADVAEEIFAEIEKAIYHLETPLGKYLVINSGRLAELKKKYIGEDTNVTTKESEGGE